MSETVVAELREELAAWTAAGLRRELRLPCGRDFTSNDYLGLSRDTRLVETARRAVAEWGVGAAAARLLRGHLAPHAQAEREAADWANDARALLFPSGWHANLAMVATLAGPDDALFSDAANHASLIDGCRLASAARHVFPHGDLDALDRLLARAGGARRRLIVVESVDSMNGERAPLAELGALAERRDAWLLVDEAHAAGLYPFSRSSRILARSFTGGKALGICGGFVSGGEEVVEALLQRARSFVFTTALPPATAATLRHAIELARTEPERAERAHAAAGRLRAALRSKGIPAGGVSPIVPVVLGDERRTLAVAEHVQREGFDVRAVRPPTVARGTSRLRLVCHANHEAGDLDALARAVATAVRAHPASPRTTGSATPDSAPPIATPLVVAGTDTGVGKTVVSALLLRAAERAGVALDYWKPVQTGDDSDTATVSALTERRFRPPAVELALPASVDQAAEAEAVRVDVAALRSAARDILAAGEPGTTCVFECAGGLLVPINESEDQADFLRTLGAPVVLVARSGLGTLNHTLLSVAALDARRLPLRALFLVGPRHEANVRTLTGRLPGTPIFELPHLPHVDAAALDAWLDTNDLAECLS